MALEATVTIRGNVLAVTAHAAVLTLTLGAPAVEWIRQDILGGVGNWREQHFIESASVSLTEKGVAVSLGRPGANAYPLFKTLQPHSRGILLDRQTAANNNDRPLWNVVTLV